MPYYKWQGVTLQGTLVRGRLFAWSQEQLDEQLLRRKIALLKSKQVRSWQLYARVQLVDKIGIFRQLFVLVTAGILLPDALTIVAEQTHQARLEEVMHAFAARVQEGESISKVMQEYPMLCDSLMIQLLSVGEQSGALAVALEAIVHYLQARHDFYTQVSAALFVPGITLCFFVTVVSMIFIFIIPRFADLFASLGQDLPPLTKTMIGISDYVLSWPFVWVLVGLSVGMTCVRVLLKRERAAQVWDSFMLRIPYVGRVIAYQRWSYFFESVGLLLSGGIQLMPTLLAVQGTIAHRSFYTTVERIVEHVKQGNSLSCALEMLDDPLVSSDIVSIVRVGQEVGVLDTMLKQVSALYHHKMKKLLSSFTMLIQPILIILLGLLVLLLIVAIYTPILHMSYAV